MGIDEVHKYITKQLKNNFLRLLFLLLTFSFVITICSHRVERKIIHPLDSYPQKLIPSSLGSTDEAQVYSQIYETLLQLGPDGSTITGNLARTWAYSDSNRCLQFELQKGIPFHDGSWLDAKAAKISIEWLKSNTDFPLLSNICKVDTIDKYTFKIFLFRPDARFLYYLASRKGIIIISPKTIANNTVSESPVGTGPFSFTSRDSVNIVLSAFKEYRQRKGNVEKIIFRYFPYSNKLKKAFRNNEVDLIYLVDGYSIDRLQWSGKMKYLVQKPVFTSFLAFNLNNRIIRKKYFRKAVVSALNLKKILVNLNRGGAISAISPLPEIYPGFNDIKQDTFNLAKAKQEIQNLDVTDRNVNLVYRTNSLLREMLIEVFKTELGKSGIHINAIGLNSTDQYYKTRKSDSVSFFFYAWKSDIIGDPGYYLYSLFYSKSVYNVFNYHNELVDHLLLASQREFDGRKRRLLYRKILKQILDDPPVVFLDHLKEYYAYNSNKIKSLKMSPYGVINYKDMVIDEAY